MSYYFAFKPAVSIIELYQECLAQAQNQTRDDLYKLRDEMTLKVNDSVIDTTMIQLIEHFPESEEKQTLLKAAHFCQSTSMTLLKQILNKVSNEEVRASFDYLNHLLHPLGGDLHIAVLLPDTLAGNLQNSFQTIIAGNDTPALRSTLTEQMHQLVSLLVEHFLDEFVATLSLGLIKRKACDFARAGIMKIISIAINRLIPKIGRSQMLAFAQYYQSLIINE